MAYPKTPDQVFSESKNFENAVKSLQSKEYLFFTHLNKPNIYRFRKPEIVEKFENESIHVDGEKFFYDLNEDGFRSKSFKKFNKNNLNVVFAGCSVTFGMGLPEDNTWYKKLINKIAKDNKKEIDFYNLSINGASTQLIIKNIITFLNNIGKPDYLFLLLPETSRSLVWDGERYINQHHDVKNKHDKNEFYEKFIKDYSFENSIMNESTMIHLVELLCKMSGIKLIWSSWDQKTNKTFNKIKYYNHINIQYDIVDYWLCPPELFKDIYYETDRQEGYYNIMLKVLNSRNENNEPYWVCARDGYHFGSYFHSMIADEFFKEIQRRKWHGK